MDNIDFYNERQTAEWLAQLPVFLGEREMLRRIAALHAVRVYDIGCGAGRLYPNLFAGNCIYYGLDNAGSQVSMFVENFPEANVTVGSATDLPWSEDSADVVILAYHVVESILPYQRRLQVFQEARRVLKSGGLCFFSHHVRSRYRFSDQIKYFLSSPVFPREFGDVVVSDSTGVGGMHLEQYSMHIPSRRELQRIAKQTSFRRGAVWPFDDKPENIRRCSSLIEEWIAI